VIFILQDNFLSFMESRLDPDSDQPSGTMKIVLLLAGIIMDFVAEYCKPCPKPLFFILHQGSSCTSYSATFDYSFWAVAANLTSRNQMVLTVRREKCLWLCLFTSWAIVIRKYTHFKGLWNVSACRRPLAIFLFWILVEHEKKIHKNLHERD